MYKIDLIDWKSKKESIKELTKWTLASIKQDLQQLYAPSGQTVRQWARKICNANIHTVAHEQTDALNKYRAHLKSLGKSSKSLIDWIQKWERLLGEGEALKASDCVTVATWCQDLLATTARNPLLEA